MAARKKTISKAASDTNGSRATAVILEQMQAQFRAFGEALDVVREQMQRGFAEVKAELRDLRIQLGDVRVAVDRKVDRDEVGGIVERAIARAVDR